MSATPPYRLEEQIGFQLRLANQRHLAIFQAESPHGLTPTQFSAVVRVAELGSCSQNELGRKTKMDVATIKGVVDRLLEKGLITVSSDPSDKRRKLVALSEAGQAAIPQLHAFGRQVTAATLEPLSDGEQQHLIRLISKLS